MRPSTFESDVKHTRQLVQLLIQDQIITQIRAPKRRKGLSERLFLYIKKKNLKNADLAG